MGHWNGTLCLDKLQDTGGRKNHGCASLTASRKLPAYDWKDWQKWHTLVEEKTGIRERTNVKLAQDKAMANHSRTVIFA